MAKNVDLGVPIFKALEPVYGSGLLLAEAQQRFNDTKSKFIHFFGHPPLVYARSPGKYYQKKKTPQILHSFIICNCSHY